jgi:hypothetical protein
MQFRAPEAVRALDQRRPANQIDAVYRQTPFSPVSKRRSWIEIHRHNYRAVNSNATCQVAVTRSFAVTYGDTACLPAGAIVCFCHCSDPWTQTKTRQPATLSLGMRHGASTGCQPDAALCRDSAVSDTATMSLADPGPLERPLVDMPNGGHRDA